ncbi:MAG: sigma-70 family RNA polymerase sigma factor [Myxococcales bacterium]|nr:sigma-70 family RNA polymerase sigma factor [Myxococcales bacterium]
MAAAVEVALAEQWARAVAAWPSVTLPFDEVVALWAARVQEVEPAGLADAIAALRAADLAIAAACAAGDPAALRAFDATYLGNLRAVLARVTTSAAEVAEVAQIVREKLLVPGAAGRARILDTAGHGDLGGLVRVIAIRTALNLRRAEQRQDPLEDHAELATLAPESDPELAAIQAQHRALIKAALEAALAGLEPRQRSVLRMHLVEGLTIDEIGRAHDVHRATAARWLEHVRDELRAATLRGLRARLGGDADGVASLIRVLDSRLQVSFQRLLATGP